MRHAEVSVCCNATPTVKSWSSPSRLRVSWLQRLDQVLPNLVSYCSSVSSSAARITRQVPLVAIVGAVFRLRGACEKASQWLVALGLFAEMRPRWIASTQSQQPMVPVLFVWSVLLEAGHSERDRFQLSHQRVRERR